MLGNIRKIAVKKTTFFEANLKNNMKYFCARELNTLKIYFACTRRKLSATSHYPLWVQNAIVCIKNELNFYDLAEIP